MALSHFCTLFDRKYLVKGVVMLRSLLEHCAHAEVYVLCMDEVTQSILAQLQLPRVHLVPLARIEDDALRAIKPSRGTGEYCWTLSPCLPLALLKTYPHLPSITYLDADLMFFASPDPLLEEIGAHSIAVIEHRFSPALQHNQVNGRFCVEWVGFRRDPEGLACLERWRQQCLDWCFYRLEGDRMGDQKYLDEWPERYPNLHILRHLGAGVAPWNFEQFEITETANGTLTVNGVPLIFYHFHQFEILGGGRFVRLPAYCERVKPAPEPIYAAYEKRIAATLREVERLHPEFRSGIRSPLYVAARRFAQRFLPSFLKSFLRRFIRY